VKRVVILGRGGSGNSTLAAKLGAITGLPVIELDKIFWQPGLEAMSHAEWVKTQQRLVEREHWIMDGDLGHQDAVEVRSRAAESSNRPSYTIILLDFALVRCAWRAFAARAGAQRFLAMADSVSTAKPAYADASYRQICATCGASFY
jgi:adenylate kinase family enzyme